MTQGRSAAAGVALPVRWGLVAAIVLVVILLPFALLERGVNDWTLQQLQAGAQRSWIAIVVVGLLATDVLLPVPSSLVSTAAGASLGFVLGVAASVAGMTICSQVGYLIGRTFGLPIVTRIVSKRHLDVASDRLRERATGALVVMRAVPVLAEASVLMAGVFRVSPTRFFLSTFFANVGISIAYCSVGALALRMDSFLAAFVGAIAVPIVMLRLAARYYPSQRTLST